MRFQLRSRPPASSRLPLAAFRGAEDRGIGELDDGCDDVTELLRQSVLQPLPAAPRRPPLLADLPVVVESLREREEPYESVSLARNASST